MSIFLFYPTCSVLLVHKNQMILTKVFHYRLDGIRSHTAKLPLTTCFNWLLWL